MYRFHIVSRSINVSLRTRVNCIKTFFFLIKNGMSSEKKEETSVEKMTQSIGPLSATYFESDLETQPL